MGGAVIMSHTSDSRGSMNPAVILVAICSAIVGVSCGMHSPEVPVFAREQLAADYWQVGLIGTANFLPFMFAPLFIGILLDRLNKSYVLPLWHPT